MSIKECLLDAKGIRAPFPASTANDVGDLLFWDNSAKFAKKASVRTDLGSAALNQADFVPLFLGIAADQRLVGEAGVTTVASQPRGPSDRMVITEGVFDCDCASATFEIGDLVGVARDSGNSVNFNQKVVGVATENLAIGYVIQREPTAVTKVRCWISARRYGWWKTAAGGGGGQGENEINTNITTVGAGTLTAAALLGGVITRSGPTAAATDTTDTAALIIAGAPIQDVGTAWEVTIKNTTNFPITLAGGTGVTLSGQTVIPPNSVYRGLAIIASSTTVTLRGLLVSPMANLPDAQYSTAALQSAVVPAANMAGARTVHFENTGTTPGNLQSDTAANIVAAIPNAQVGMTYTLKIRNSSGSANTATITTNTGITLHGTMTIAQNVTREFVVVLTSLTAVDIYSMGISAAGA